MVATSRHPKTPRRARAFLRRGRKRAPYRPCLELLENRLTPSTFVVNTLADTVAVDLTSGADSTGHISLRSAIMAANQTPGTDTIILGPGTYQLTIPVGEGDADDSGDLNITDNLNIQGSPGTVIDAQHIDRVFTVLGGVTAQMSNLTIENGQADGAGGGIANFGNLTLTDCWLLDNVSQGAGVLAAGGGVYNDGALQLVNTTFSGNQAIGANGQNGSAFGAGGGGGGAAGMGGAVFNDAAGVVTATNSTFSSNEAVGGNGGSGFPNNGAFSGQGGNGGGPSGGLGGPSGSAGGAGGFASGGGGGGGVAFGHPNGGPGGFGGGGGGGGGQTSGFSGGNGGAGSFGGGDGGLAQNSAAAGGGGGAGLGGAIFNNGGVVSLLNVTVASNFAVGGLGGTGGFGVGGGADGNGVGGGLYINGNGGTVFLKNTLLANNSAPSGTDLFGGVLSQGHNLIGNTGGAANSFLPSDLQNVNPQLGSLQDNGGPTPTMALLPGSPAINAGDDAGAPATDQRGRTRNSPVDIGAYEFESSLAVTAGPESFLAVGAEFQGSGAFTDDGAGSWTVQADYGDLTGPQDINFRPDHTFDLNHVYTQEGTYTVRVRVTDQFGHADAAPFFVHVFVAPPNEPARVTAAPGTTVTVQSGSITVELTRAPDTRGSGSLVVAELPPEVGAADSVAAFDLRSINLGPRDRAVVTFEVFSPNGQAPAVVVFDPVTGQPVPVVGSRREANSLTVTLIPGRPGFFSVRVVLDATSTPPLFLLRGTILSIVVPQARPDSGSTTPPPVQVVSATAGAGLGGLDGSFGRSGLSGGAETTIATSPSQSQQLDAGGGGPMSTDTTFVEGMLYSSHEAFWQSMGNSSPPESSNTPREPEHKLTPGVKLMPEARDRVFANPMEVLPLVPPLEWPSAPPDKAPLGDGEPLWSPAALALLAVAVATGGTRRTGQKSEVRNQRSETRDRKSV
jgi:hypothetical protein